MPPGSGVQSVEAVFLLLLVFVAVFAGLARRLKVAPIFALLERKYDVPLIEAEYRLEAVAAEAEVAAALRLKQGSPIFRIERTSYSIGNRPVDYESCTTGATWSAS